MFTYGDQFGQYLLDQIDGLTDTADINLTLNNAFRSKVNTCLKMNGTFNGINPSGVASGPIPVSVNATASGNFLPPTSLYTLESLNNHTQINLNFNTAFIPATTFILPAATFVPMVFLLNTTGLPPLAISDSTFSSLADNKDSLKAMVEEMVNALISQVNPLIMTTPVTTTSTFTGLISGVTFTWTWS